MSALILIEQLVDGSISFMVDYDFLINVLYLAIDYVVMHFSIIYYSIHDFDDRFKIHFQLNDVVMVIARDFDSHAFQGSVAPQLQNSDESIALGEVPNDFVQTLDIISYL